MKIAIMTQPLGKNYGGIMQAWALQQVLKSMGHKPVTIDRQMETRNTFYKLARFSFRAVSKVAGKRKRPINFEKYLPDILEYTNQFVGKRILLSEPIADTVSLREHFEKAEYDTVVVGSDQTWRPKYSPNIGNYYLDFLQDSCIRKVAYASSFGVDEWEYTEEQTSQFKDLLAEFDAVSVREGSGVLLCRKKLAVEADLVLDPTLLMTSDDYLNLLELNSSRRAGGGVFSYILDESHEKKEITNLVCEQLGLNSFSCQPKVSIFEDIKDVSLHKYPAVEQWVESFIKSDFVVTDSFHGCVFSIIFNKPFFAIGNESRGLARFNSLLGGLELQSRLVGNVGMAKAVINDEIDWNDVSDLLAKKKMLSLSFLEKSINA